MVCAKIRHPILGDDMLVVITNLEPSKEYYLSAAGSNLAGKSDFVAADRVFHTSAPRGTIL